MVNNLRKTGRKLDIVQTGHEFFAPINYRTVPDYYVCLPLFSDVRIPEPYQQLDLKEDHQHE